MDEENIGRRLRARRAVPKGVQSAGDVREPSRAHGIHAQTQDTPGRARPRSRCTTPAKGRGRRRAPPPWGFGEPSVLLVPIVRI